MWLFELLSLVSAVCMCVFSRIQLFVTPWTGARQAPLSMGLPRQEYWSGLPFPPPVSLPNPGTEPASLASPALAGGFSTVVPPGKSRISDTDSNMELPFSEASRVLKITVLLTAVK